MVNAALSLAKCGLRVFPVHGVTADGSGPTCCTCGLPGCSSIGKHPIARGWQEQATTATERVAELWRKHPWANVGIACGNGLAVVDIDGDTGRLSLEALEQRHGRLPKTWRVRTGGGGQHIYFRCEKDLPNRVRFAPGMDARSQGGLVVGPGSVHASGGCYKWEPGHSPQDAELAEMPQWLFDAVLGAAALNPAATTKPSARDILERYLGRAQPGCRNEVGFALACQLRDNGVSQSEAACLLREYAARVPGDGYSVAEALASVEQAYGRPPREPWATPAAADRPEGALPGAGPDALPLTDLGNAERLIRAHGENLRFDADAGRWLRWIGTHWEADTTGGIQRLAAQVVRRMYGLLPDIADRSTADSWFAHIRRSESQQRLQAMVSLAATLDGVPVTSVELDSNPWLLTCKNGTVDLRTGRLLPHSREHLITRCLPVDYTADADCPTWLRFLNAVFGGDKELIDFVQRAIGYSLTGDTSEQCFFFLHGGGSNGKSTLLSVLREILGDHHRKVGTDTLLDRTDSTIPNDLARLRGARVVTAIEAKPGRKLAETLVKELTGGDAITARFLRQEYFEFVPTFKLWLACNHLPTIDGQDCAIWRRIRLIPFNVTFSPPESGQPPYQDKMLLPKLRAEYPGILAWGVRGCLEWQERGLREPKAVIAAVEGYQGDMDVLGDFLADCCDIHPGARVKAAELYAAYMAWAESEGERFPLSKRAFGLRLGERGTFQRVSVHGCRYWTGLELKQGSAGGERAPKAPIFSDSPINSHDRENMKLTGNPDLSVPSVPEPSSLSVNPPAEAPEPDIMAALEKRGMIATEPGDSLKTCSNCGDPVEPCPNLDVPGWMSYACAACGHTANYEQKGGDR